MTIAGLDSSVALFVALVAREPTSEERRWLAHEVACAPALLRRNLLRSEAFLAARGQREDVLQGLFTASGEPGLPRIGVISNCQGPELARWLALSTGAATVGAEVMLYQPDLRDLFLRPFAGCDWILAAPFQSEQFQGLQACELAERFPGRVVTIPSINFSGLQPDIVQLGLMNARLPSPIEAHSRLIVSGYLRGLGATETLASFNADTFAEHGFFDRWAEAEAEMRERERTCHVSITDDLVDLCRRLPAMFTENHPAGLVYLALARKIARLIGLPFHEPPCALLPTVHALSTAWPVYDEIALHHALPYRTTQLYSTLEQMLARRELVERCFATYDAADRSELAAAARDRSIPF